MFLDVAFVLGIVVWIVLSSFRPKKRSFHEVDFNYRPFLYADTPKKRYRLF